MCYIRKYTAYTTGNKMSSAVAGKTSYLTHCTVNSCTRHQGSSRSLAHSGKGLPSPHPLAIWGPHLPSPPSTPPHLFSSFFFLLFICIFFSVFVSKVQTYPPPQETMAVVPPGSTPHTQHSDLCVHPSRSGAAPHSQPPSPATFSVRMLTAKASGPLRRWAPW